VNPEDYPSQSLGGQTIRQLGTQPYFPVWQAMQRFTEQRNHNTADEWWVTEHLPVFTQGRNGKAEHLLNPGQIPVIPIDRGGQITYHGPGQVIVYLLLDLQRRKLGIRQLVQRMEQALIHCLAHYQISANLHSGAPGVYVDKEKIAALGLRIRRGCSYHGLSLNVNMDLQPFQCINPCGYAGLKVTQMAHFITPPTTVTLIDTLLAALHHQLGNTPL